MQKVVCPACGFANLESFPAFPLCAGCGARLPQRKSRPLHAFFQRPVKTLVWAFCVGAGVAILALLSTGIARETQLRDRGPLLITPSFQTAAPNQGADLILSLRVKTSEDGDRETIHNLQLRMNQSTAREYGMQVISPPATIEERGSGRYYVWKEFSPGQTIKAILRPQPAIEVEMLANGFEPFDKNISPPPYR